MSVCPVCDSTLERTHPDWVSLCPTCRFLKSSLRPSISETSSEDEIDEALRETALKHLRQSNFERILTLLHQTQACSGRRLLEVGSAHGWFLDQAAQFGFHCYGVEPDPWPLSRTSTESHTVWKGFFPEAIPKTETFDVIVFNDVFEHLPDVQLAMRSCVHHLEENGVLVINLPLSTGTIYRLASALKGLGMISPYDRMWQKSFVSPHTCYFTQDNLARLARRFQLTEILRASLPSIRIHGLWERLRFDRKSSILISAGLWMAMVALMPTLRLLPPDIGVQFFRRTHD